MPEALDTTTLQNRVDEIDWFHSMNIAPGVRSKGHYDPSIHFDRAQFPTNLTGKSVLDIGAWDGFYSFEAERRGASRVLATDSWAWQGRSPLPFREGDPTPRFGSKRGFDLVHEVRDSKVESMEIDVMDLSPEKVGTFDVVCFLGVLYHLPHMFLAIEKVASVCDGLLILETQTDMLLSRRPSAAFYPGDDLRGDESNWWAPNLPGLSGMLRAAGFTDIEFKWAPGLVHRAGSWAKQARSGNRKPLLTSLSQSRTMLHARK
jgi:tRNA (mo5U34)-methyltransferase